MSGSQQQLSKSHSYKEAALGSTGTGSEQLFTAMMAIELSAVFLWTNRNAFFLLQYQSSKDLCTTDSTALHWLLSAFAEYSQVKMGFTNVPRTKEGLFQIQVKEGQYICDADLGWANLSCILILMCTFNLMRLNPTSFCFPKYTSSTT